MTAARTRLPNLKRIILESPYAGDVECNVAYARVCLCDSLMRGEAPIASHLLYTQDGVLNDNDPEQRRHGIDAGHAWLEVAEAVVFYVDLGMSSGMETAWLRARDAGVKCERRKVAEFSPESRAACKGAGECSHT